MNVLCIRTDKEEAELYIYVDSKQAASVKWVAHRKLTATIHKKLTLILNKSSIKLDELDGIVAFAGPGSFTGLRIGLAVANALALANNIPVVGRQSDQWIERGLKDLRSGKNDKIAKPIYNRPAATTPPKK